MGLNSTQIQFLSILFQNLHYVQSHFNLALAIISLFKQKTCFRILSTWMLLLIASGGSAIFSSNVWVWSTKTILIASIKADTCELFVFLTKLDTSHNSMWKVFTKVSVLQLNAPNLWPSSGLKTNMPFQTLICFCCWCSCFEHLHINLFSLSQQSLSPKFCIIYIINHNTNLITRTKKKSEWS